MSERNEQHEQQSARHQQALMSVLDMIKAGFMRPQAAYHTLQKLQECCSPMQLQAICSSIVHVEDPDAALIALYDIIQAHPKVLSWLLDSGQQNQAIDSLLRVLGASASMATLMRTRPALIRAAAYDPRHTLHMTREQRIADMLDVVSANKATVVIANADNHDERTVTMPICPLGFVEAVDLLRSRYREHVAAIMAFDLASADPMDVQPTVSQKLSDAADAVLQTALAIARGQVQGASACRFAIIAMGKLGAQEINYVSDIDVMYVVEPTDQQHSENVLRLATSMAMVLQKVCQSVIMGCDEAPLWQIDTALRPEGKDGPLVRRLQSYREYYERWASSWEFQALLKARGCAGDSQLAHEYVQMVEPLVWKASHREHFVADCQQMRQRVERLIPLSQQELDMKLGRGGLRDVEFTVQMLQLVHGSSDSSLHVAGTLDALQALATGGYVSRSQAAILAEHYRFERVLEHRQQMWMMRRTHLFPDLGKSANGGLERKRMLAPEVLEHNEPLRRLARSLHTSAEELIARYDTARREIRHLHQDIYYRPMLPINAQSGTDPIELPLEVARERFLAIGFADPDAAMRHVQALTDGLSRAAKIHRILLPAVLQWLGEGQNPDMGLLSWRRLSERFGGKNTYLGFLRDSQSAAQRLCHVLSNSRYLGEAMMRSMQSITWLGDDGLLQPRSRNDLDVQMHAIAQRYAHSDVDVAQALRASRRQEIERIALAWSCNVIDDNASMQSMSDVTDALFAAALDWASMNVMHHMQFSVAPAKFAVIAMGRYGGREVNFCSDADVMLVYESTMTSCSDNAFALVDRFVQGVVALLRRILQSPITVEPAIEIDLDLRPEGKNGPLIRSYASYQQYYEHWASTWERQALLRARFAAGDAQLGKRFIEQIVNPLRYAESAISDEQISEIRKLKARMEAERLPRAVRYDRHMKLGRGGLSDVEWTVQLMQLRYAEANPSLQVTSTMQALQELTRLKLVTSEQAEVLERAWRWCSAARNANYLWTGSIERADIIPTDSYSLSGMAIYLGYESNQGRQFENDLLALMRQCREIMVALFYEK